jgi:bifunctional UDP-N-acetylglucosamine pyrophosphorylase / glucosamine-1-phosphate N-acetyltransferase
MTLAAVILAAGQGTRMHSAMPKVLHRLGGQPLLSYALESARAVTGRTPVLVIGHGAEAVRAAFGERAEYAVQAEALGTAHAVMQAAGLLPASGADVLVTYADMPLLRESTLRALAETQAANSGPLTFLTIDSPDRRDFGRVVRDSAGQVQAVVEAALATPEQWRLTEVNVGAYCFNAEWLWQALARLAPSAKGEYFLTDLVGMAIAEGLRAATVTIEEQDEVVGVNTRAQLAEAEAALRWRINRHWMDSGVTLIDPAATYIEAGCAIGPDSVVLPNTHLTGATRVGARCVIGPNTIVRDSTLGDDCRIEASVVEGASLAEEVTVGPFAHLRQGAQLGRGVHMGNFGEVKNSTLGPGVKMGHFSYVGDATIGADVNIGAGTVTCNYDGVRKNRTVIEDGVFVGSDTMLVAPVTLGQGSRTGAGAVVTKDIPPHTLAVGQPARAIRKLK